MLIMTRLKTIQIIDLLADYTPVTPIENDPFYISIPQSETEYLTITPSNLIDYMIHKYGDFSFTYYDIKNKTDIQQFVEEWQRYVVFNKSNWNDIVYAYSMDYNPIHNYDKTETRNFAKQYSNTTNSSGNNDTEYSEQGTLTNTQTFNNYKTENNATSFQGTTNKVSDNTVTGNIENVRSNDNYKTNNNTDYSAHTIVTGTEDIINDTTTVSGNIGVTTTQQMIESEIELRRLNMIEHIADNFALENFILLNGDDENEYRCI